MSVRRLQEERSWDIGYLRQPNATPVTAQVKSKALIASYVYCEVYDFNTGEWQIQNWMKARGGIGAAWTCKYAFFAGGRLQPNRYAKNIDIYNAETNN